MVRTVKAVAGLVWLCLAVLVGAVMDCPGSSACVRVRKGRKTKIPAPGNALGVGPGKRPYQSSRARQMTLVI